MRSETPSDSSLSDKPGSDVPGSLELNRAATTATSAALGAAVTGALVGSVAGPVGTALGAAAGALVAGAGGYAVANSVDSKAEAEYWRSNYRDRPYVDADASFDDYSPAYAHGLVGATVHQQSSFDEAEAELESGWASARGSSRLEWERAREASLDAWLRARAHYVTPSR